MIRFVGVLSGLIENVLVWKGAGDKSKLMTDEWVAKLKPAFVSIGPLASTLACAQGSVAWTRLSTGGGAWGSYAHWS